MSRLSVRERIARARALRGNQAAYTMIEVMMALTILAVGSSGVVALQKVTILGVTGGRNMTAASAIGAAHLEAVRADAVQWTSAATMANAALLTQLTTPADVWKVPAAGLAGLGESDVTGTTTASPNPNPVAYCTQLRASIIANDAVPAPILVRVESRTFWAKSGRDVSAECADASSPTLMNNILLGNPSTFGTVTFGPDEYSWVFFATSIRRNDLGT